MQLSEAMKLNEIEVIIQIVFKFCMVLQIKKTPLKITCTE